MTGQITNTKEFIQKCNKCEQLIVDVINLNSMQPPEAIASLLSCLVNAIKSAQPYMHAGADKEFCISCAEYLISYAKKETK